MRQGEKSYAMKQHGRRTSQKRGNQKKKRACQGKPPKGKTKKTGEKIAGPGKTTTFERSAPLTRKKKVIPNSGQ